MKNKIGVGTFKTTPETRALVNQVLDSERISYGPMSKELERRFSKLHECNYGVLSNSGTSSLQVSLQAMKELHGWDDGDAVVIPAVTFVATANIVLHNRMVPILADVDEETYNIDPDKLDEAVRKSDSYVRAVIPVHLFGQPANMSEVTEVAITHDLRVIEDSCECMFATHAGTSVGSWGDIGCFSFYVAHLLTAGVGGISTTNNPDYAAKMRSLVNHGRDGIYIATGDDDGKSAEELREIVSRRFRFESIGHSFRITEFEAAIGLAQLSEYSAMIAQRQRNAETLTRILSPLDGATLQTPAIADHNTHSFMMYPIVLLEESKWEMCNWLEQGGIETREMLPLTNQPVYGGMWNTRDYPVADWINRCGFYVGVHQDLGDEDMEYIGEKISGYFENAVHNPY